MSERVPHMPAIFVGHGSPMNALGGPYAETWRALGESLPRPKAILCISAHWYVEETAVTAMSSPRTIHDFYGFPKPLYDIAYPAPGDAWLADRVTDLLAPVPVRHDHEWGLDHGAWSVLMHLFPRADVPVLQLAIDRRQPPAFHYELGRKLAELRDEGVLILGSGDWVHNLGLAIRAQSATPFDWAERFNETVKALIAAHDHGPLIDWISLGQDAALSIPTDEHYLPLLYVLGAQGEGDEVNFFNDAVELGAISMTGVTIGRAG
ncbi:4,5-DOPA dioxygenase extradiol [Phenylobacterium sp. LH3H17]|uniref:4,5-DOPA-extradiol-dioxygenase n=1 Tax=Phenylobacterium sp. LH3H17 TaxID=2903901 RepID=UPI0020C9EE3E|nr:4,5-DOPA dioxygenase extradiol [Phenylobacterium sp. LH3H17]UTP38675.1 4,5-DOPA dioxygenase extradiol [Phenylobacterium sp. LH3H17]